MLIINWAKQQLHNVMSPQTRELNATSCRPIVDIFYLFSDFFYIFLDITCIYIHCCPFKSPIVLNVAIGLTINRNIYNFSMHIHITDP